MRKDRFYFSHDYHSRNDDKMSLMIVDWKAKGYGIFWAITEKLHEEKNSINLTDRTIKVLAKDLCEKEGIIKKFIEGCVKEYKLLDLSEEGILSSKRVKFNLDERERISNLRSEAAKNKKRQESNGEQLHDNRSSNEEQLDSKKEHKIKGKEKKEIKPKENGVLDFSSPGKNYDDKKFEEELGLP